MKRFLLYPLAAAAAIVPAGTGLMANGTFSQDVAVRPPSEAQVLVVDTPTPSRSASPSRLAQRLAERLAQQRRDRRPRRRPPPCDRHA